MEKLALFDFDGTITSRDTLFLFLRYIKGDFFFFRHMTLLLPIFLLYFLRIITNEQAKTIVLRKFLKGLPIEVVSQKAEAFVVNKLPGFIRMGALQNINDLIRQEAQVVIVTASAEFWVKPWCDQLGILCIGTKLEVCNGKLTGRLVGKNCYGIEKVNRIKGMINLESFKTIMAYGDSKGDLPMLSLAHDKFYKPFRTDNG